MDTQFYISMTQRTPKGLESFGRFFLSHHDAGQAYELFAQLQGSTDVSSDNVLFLELMEIRHGLPANVKMKSCTLQELGENCKLIAREVFKSQLLRSS